MMDEVRHVRISKTYRSETKKLEFTMSPGTLAEATYKSMIPWLRSHSKGDLKQGVAPMTEIERQLQAALEEMQA